jgi:hypothetical protein
MAKQINPARMQTASPKKKNVAVNMNVVLREWP